MYARISCWMLDECISFFSNLYFFYFYSLLLYAREAIVRRVYHPFGVYDSNFGLYNEIMIRCVGLEDSCSAFVFYGECLRLDVIAI